jgi:hypothetical protein
VLYLSRVLPGEELLYLSPDVRPERAVLPLRPSGLRHDMLRYWSGLLRHHMLRCWCGLLRHRMLRGRLLLLQWRVQGDQAFPEHWLHSGISYRSRMGRVVLVAESRTRIGRGVT